MNCVDFQDLLSDYLDGALDARVRAECAGHRLICRECRELYTDVRETVQMMGSLAFVEGEAAELTGLETRILAATTAGEMLSCGEFDRLIERYFDGVMLAPDHQAFQAHFEHCHKCRRLMAGIEEAIEMCREVKELEVEMPSTLPERIVSATVGQQTKTFWSQFGGFGLLGTVAARVFAPQWAAAWLILASILLLVSVRFGSFESFASHANGRAGRLLSEFNQTSEQARNSLARASFQLGHVLSTEQPKPSAPEPSPNPLQPATTVTEQAPQAAPSPKLQKAVRYEQR
ncbi:MAG: zf-HC2 domain-containing protein [Acidobacteria bacterium]|nr:zf-HC2 domain-containing protein [Acidobacteriota bacterium]MBI3425224.1 zf-HC2 domain-containing protein [Acidobacteriota bacterium]